MYKVSDQLPRVQACTKTGYTWNYTCRILILENTCVGYGPQGLFTSSYS